MVAALVLFGSLFLPWFSTRDNENSVITLRRHRAR